MYRLLFFSLLLLSISLTACQLVIQEVPEELPTPTDTPSPTLAPSPTPTEAAEQAFGEIVYIGEDGNLYTYALDTGERVPLTVDAELNPNAGLRLYDFPTWSPSGKQLAYVEISAAEGGGTVAKIFVKSAGSEGAVQLFADDQDVPFYLYWSPDSQSLSFLSSPKRSSDISLQIASLASGKVTEIDTGEPYYWAWAPEENRVFVHTGGAASTNPSAAKLSFFDLSGEYQENGLGVSPGDFQSPVFSPSGEYLLYAAENGSGQAQLILADADGGLITTLADVQGRIAFDWSPDGDVVAYLTGTTRRGILLGELALLDLSDIENPSPIATETQEVIAFFWSPDGRQLAYFVPSFSPQGDDFSASTARVQQQLQFQLYVLEVESGQSRLVTTFVPSARFINLMPYFDQYQRSISLWSPESDALVVSAAGNGDGESILIVPVSGNRSAQTIAKGTLAFWSWPK
jgi:TolB protein